MVFCSFIEMIYVSNMQISLMNANFYALIFIPIVFFFVRVNVWIWISFVIHIQKKMSFGWTSNKIPKMIVTRFLRMKIKFTRANTRSKNTTKTNTRKKTYSKSENLFFFCPNLVWFRVDNKPQHHFSVCTNTPFKFSVYICFKYRYKCSATVRQSREQHSKTYNN